MSIEALKDAKSVISSINASRHHEITIGGEKVFWQREEWVRWALDEVLPVISKAIADATHGNAEDQYIEMSKHLNCPQCGGSGHIDDVAEKQEPVSMQMDVIVVNLVREGVNKHRARELAEHFIKHTHQQPKHEPKRCGVCGEDEAFTGSCGAGKDNPNALCYTHPQPKQSDCARSHPHENMNEMCELRSEIARLTNQLAQPKREPLTDEWIRSKCNQTWVFDTVKQWVKEVEAAHGIKEKNT